MGSKSPKSAGNTPKRRPRGTPFSGAGDPRNGRGPAKGAWNAGRPPDEFKAMCAELASREKTYQACRAILGNSDHPQFVRALQWATDNGYGPPAQRHEHTGADGGAVPHEIVVRFVKAAGSGEPR